MNIKGLQSVFNGGGNSGRAKGKGDKVVNIIKVLCMHV
jgi:hypothetical protein